LNLRPPRPERGRYVILDASMMRNPWWRRCGEWRFGADLPRPSTKPLDVLVFMWLDNDMTATTNRNTGTAGERGAAMSDFTAIPHGHLTEGTVTHLGVIEQVSFTAYLIDGRWVPFSGIHGAYRPVMPLVVLS
jgi:hypothetical protein